MRLVLRATLEAVHVGLGFLGFLALAGVAVRDRASLSSAAALAIMLGTVYYIKRRRQGKA